MTTQGMRQAFRRVLAREAGTHADKTAIASATRRLCGHLAHRLSPVVGDSGVAAIYARSLYLARQAAGSDVPGSALDQDDRVFMRMQDFVEQQDGGAAAAAVVVLTSAAEVLTSVVGKGLATRLLQDAWPDGFRRRPLNTLETRDTSKRSARGSGNSKPPAHPGTDVGRVLDRLREANARLIVGAIHAQNVSAQVRLETAQARAEVDDLIHQLWSANERLAAGAAQAQAMAAEAQMRHEEYRQLSGRLLTLQDQERRRLALDLHDSTAQRLAALVMNLDVLGKNRRNMDAASRRALAASRSLAQQCVREVRTFAHLLHPPLLDEAGLVSALRWFVEGFTRRSGIRVELVLDEVQRLPAAIETALFRVVQESLTNVHRHASHASVIVRIAQSAGTVALDVHDDGRGVSDGQRDAHGKRRPVTLGVGIQGMRERIVQLGGTFDVTFGDHGTTVRVRVPLVDMP